MSKIRVEVGAVGTSTNKTDYYYLFEIREGKLEKNAQENVERFDIGLYSEDTTKTLYITQKGECSSLYEPNLEVVRQHSKAAEKRFTPISTKQVQVRRMDNILPADLIIDYLKIDTQGSELDVLKGAGDLLYNVRTVECEVEFVELYKGQPLFEDIKEYLNQYGLVFDRYRREVRWESRVRVFGDAIFKRV